MKRDSRLSLALHGLLRMMEQSGPVTSEDLGKSMSVNPVMFRRTMAGLRGAGLVNSIKGHGGGWIIARDPIEISILDIYLALNEPILIHQHRSAENIECLVERTVGHSLNEVFNEAEELIIKRFEKITLFALSAKLHAQINKRRNKKKE